jgi:hypothetical protein
MTSRGWSFTLVARGSRIFALFPLVYYSISGKKSLARPAISSASKLRCDWDTTNWINTSKSSELLLVFFRLLNPYQFTAFSLSSLPTPRGKLPRGKLLWKKRTKIFGIRKSRQFFLGFWDFFQKFKGFRDHISPITY